MFILFLKNISVKRFSRETPKSGVNTVTNNIFQELEKDKSKWLFLLNLDDDMFAFLSVCACVHHCMGVQTCAFCVCSICESVCSLVYVFLCLWCVVERSRACVRDTASEGGCVY